MTEARFKEAAEPLFAEGLVDALEWTPDIGWGNEVPDWAAVALEAFSSAGRLYAHGFAFSPLSGAWEARQERWLERLSAELRVHRYQHLSEHFCFMSAGDFDACAPFPMPQTDDTVQLGRERMQRLAEVAQIPVGLENLATALAPEDVHEQGAFVDALLQPVDGFVLLDLHNLYCQAVNFGVDAVALLETWPLHRVREFHVSGGSWTSPGGARFRRDTHDAPVPREVLELLPLALDQLHARAPVERSEERRVGKECA